ncbi:MAG TPA: CopG family transcriptional regulator [Vicinamibacterales bacterium]|nr:CopG family transcriptional regulator [Vicinamibacterales bacterium]
MRTTMTLEKDVAARLEQVARKRGQSFKAIVNDALRAGLAVLDKPAGRRAPFHTSGFDLGPSLVGNMDDVEGVLARVEGESHR